MAGPWEKYQSAPAAGPWTKYAVSSDAPTDNGSVDATILGAGQGAGFNFADEGAAGMATLYDKLWSHKGLSYDDYLRRARDVQANAQAKHPIAFTGGEVGGAVGTGVLLGAGGLSAGARAAQAGRGLIATAAGGAADGAAMGALAGAGEGKTLEERGSNALTGAEYGLAAGAVVPAAGAAISRLVSPLRTPAERQVAAAILGQEGVDLSAGQVTGSKGLRYAESEIGGRAAEDMAERQGEQFTAAALRRAGIDANRATPDVIDDAFTRIGGDFDRLGAQNRLIPDQQLVQDVAGSVQDYLSVVPQSQRAPLVQNTVQDLQAAMANGLQGDAYQVMRSRLDRAARGAGGDTQLRDVLHGIRNALDDTMERSIAANNPADLGSWREARRQYRNMLVIEKAATGAGENAALGLISPSQLRNATVTGQGRRAYARGNGEFADLARSGEALMKPMPQSGTAPRMAVRGLMTAPAAIGGILGTSAGDAMWGLAGAAAGGALPRVVGALMMSRAGQAYLRNQAGANPQVRAVVNALLGSGTGSVAGRLAGP